MKTFRFNFSHPVEGIIRLIHAGNPALSRAVTLSTDPNGSANITIDNLPEGSWKAMLTWTYEGREYCWEESFQVYRITNDDQLQESK